MEKSKENDKALKSLNDKLLQIVNDRGVLASSLLSLSSKITNPDHTGLLKLVKDPDSDRVNILLRNKKVPVTSYNNLFSFCDTNKLFELKRDLSEMATNEN